MRIFAACSARFVWLVCLTLFSLGCSSDKAEPIHDGLVSDDQVETPPTEKTAGQTETTAKTRISLTPTKFQEELAKDSSGKPFYDKEIELKGVAQSAGLMNGPFVLLESIRFDTVDKEPWSKVLPGQEVTLLATVSYAEGVMVKVEKVEGERRVVSAEKLTADYEMDKEAGPVDYAKSWLEVTGKVHSVSKTETGNALVNLVGQGDALVVCRFAFGNQQEEIQALKPGDDVRIVGSHSSSASTADKIEVNQALLITE